LFGALEFAARFPVIGTNLRTFLLFVLGIR